MKHDIVVSMIRKKLANLQRLPYMPPNWWTLVHKRLRTVWRVFAHLLKFARRTSCRLTFETHFGLIIFARWRLWSTQMPRAWLALLRLCAGRPHA